VVFVSPGRLNKAHVKYLEGRLYDKAKQAERYAIENGGRPAKTRIADREEAEMTEFGDYIYLLVNTLGHSVFEPLKLPIVHTPLGGETATEETALFHLNIKDAKATGRRVSDGFVVYSGATFANDIANSVSDKVMRIRSLLLDKGALEERLNGLELTADWVFSSPSAAALAVGGGSINGLTAWVTGTGMTLRDYEASRLPPVETIPDMSTHIV